MYAYNYFVYIPLRNFKRFIMKLVEKPAQIAFQSPPPPTTGGLGLQHLALD